MVAVELYRRGIEFYSYKTDNGKEVGPLGTESWGRECARTYSYITPRRNNESIQA